MGFMAKMAGLECIWASIFWTPTILTSVPTIESYQVKIQHIIENIYYFVVNTDFKE